MESGKLRHILEIQRATQVQSSSGEAVPTWSKIGETWGDILPVRGREVFAGARFYTDITHRIIIRTFEGLTPRDRIVFGSRTFDVDSVADSRELRHQMEVLATEVV